MMDLPAPDMGGEKVTFNFTTERKSLLIRDVFNNENNRVQNRE